MVTVAYLPTFNELIAVSQLGKMTAEEVQKVLVVILCSQYIPIVTQAIEICIDGSLRMKDLMRQCLAERHKQRKQNSNSIIR